MTPEETRKAVEVMLAWAEGKAVQVVRLGSIMADVVEPNWDWSRYAFRVKPEPRRWWVTRSYLGVDFLHASPEMARLHAEENPGSDIIEVVEVVQ